MLDFRSLGDGTGSFDSSFLVILQTEGWSLAGREVAGS